jgi:hypothetical protein
MRLLSWNIHKGIGGRDRRYSLSRIIDCIEAENPDFICLQEVDRLVRRSQFDDQPRLLARYFRAHSVYQSNVAVGDGGYGNLVLSRWPVESRHRILLRQGARKPRGAQLLQIDSPEGSLHLVHTHLGLAERERHWQMNRLLGHMLFRSADQLPTLVVGDFNDWRNTLHAGGLAMALTYGLCGVLFVPLVVGLRPYTRADWVAAAQYASAWLLSMAGLYCCFGLVGVAVTVRRRRATALCPRASASAGSPLASPSKRWSRSRPP